MQVRTLAAEPAGRFYMTTKNQVTTLAAKATAVSLPGDADLLPVDDPWRYANEDHLSM